MCGSLFCSCTNLSSLRGREMSLLISTGSGSWIFMFLISHSITSSLTCVVAGGSSSKGKYPNYFPSCSGGGFMSSSISISLLKVSASVLHIPGMYSKVMS